MDGGKTMAMTIDSVLLKGVEALGGETGLENVHHPTETTREGEGQMKTFLLNNMSIRTERGSDGIPASKISTFLGLWTHKFIVKMSGPDLTAPTFNRRLPILPAARKT